MQNHLAVDKNTLCTLRNAKQEFVTCVGKQGIGIVELS